MCRKTHGSSTPQKSSGVFPVFRMLLLPVWLPKLSFHIESLGIVHSFRRVSWRYFRCMFVVWIRAIACSGGGDDLLPCGNPNGRIGVGALDADRTSRREFLPSMGAIPRWGGRCQPQLPFRSRPKWLFPFRLPHQPAMKHSIRWSFAVGVENAGKKPARGSECKVARERVSAPSPTLSHAPAMVT